MDELCIQTFLKEQTRLFPEVICENEEEARDFLENEVFAVVCKNMQEVREYFEESGMDTVGMSDEELMEAEEVFTIPDGRFLVVEG